MHYIMKDEVLGGFKRYDFSAAEIDEVLRAFDDYR